MGNIYAEHLFKGFFDILNPGITKFNHFTRLKQDMVMLLEPIGFFELGQVLPELVLADKITFYQQVKGIVYRSAAYTVIVVLHADIQRFNIKMPFPAVNFLENGKALWGLSQLPRLQETRKYSFYFGINFLI